MVRINADGVEFNVFVIRIHAPVGSIFVGGMNIQFLMAGIVARITGRDVCLAGLNVRVA